MYETFYELKEKPFTLLPDPDYLYLSPKHQRALTLLEYGMMNQAGFSVICGDTGAGKTTLIRRLLVELGDDTCVGLITNTHQSFGELLNWVLLAYNLDSEGKSKAQMHQIFISFLIEQYAQNKHTVLIVDEAQNMSADTLEELRMLSNINADKDQVLQVILAGQPALRETLRKPELMQFAQRIAVDYYLEALNIDETGAYIHHRLKVAGSKKPIFTEEACDAIYTYSGGTPRLINLLCDTSLVYGFAEQNKKISAELVHDVVREQHSNSIIPTFNTRHLKPASANEPPITSNLDSTHTNTAAQIPSENISQQKITQDALSHKTANHESLSSEQIMGDNLQSSMGNAKSATIAQSQASATSAQSAASAITGKPIADIKEIKKTKQAADHKTNSPAAKKDNTATTNVTPIDKIQTLSKENPLEQSIESDNNQLAKDAAANLEPAIEKSKLQRSIAEDEDIYPIVHIEENPKKGFNMMLLGLVAGMFLASIVMMFFAWSLIDSKDNNTSANPQQQSAELRMQQEADRRELKATQKERDAALAITRALERERDAAIRAAKIQEQIRATELKASKILAQQEHRAQLRLEKAQARAREAELAEQNARSREREVQLKAAKREALIKAQQIKQLNEQRRRADELSIKLKNAKLETEKLEKNRSTDINSIINSTNSKPIIKAKSNKKAPSNKESFSSNPCNSPSAKFLSTCKK